MYASIPSPFEAKGMVSIIYVFRYTTRNILLQSKCNWILCFTFPNFIKSRRGFLPYQASAGGSKLPYVMPKIKLKIKRFMDKKKSGLGPSVRYDTK